MKLLQRLREMRESQEALIDSIQFKQLDFSIDAGIDSYFAGSMSEQSAFEHESDSHQVGI
jgi:hypothetical protein